MFYNLLKYKRVYIFISIITLSNILTGCSQYGDFEVSEVGLQYQIIDNNRQSTLQPKLGDILELNYSYEVENGRILFNSTESGRSYLKRVDKPAHSGGSIEDGLLMLYEGDSAIFRISAENFLLFSEKYGKLPQGVEGQDFIIVKLRLIDIMDGNEMERYVATSYHNSEEQELSILQNYLQNANIEQQPTNSGMYVIEKQQGSGEKIAQGNLVTLNFTLTLVDGKLIETSLGRQPMRFVFGRDKMIPGWEEAMPMLSKGSVCQLIVPSKLAYGVEGKGDILPYSTLIFDIEILDVQ